VPSNVIQNNGRSKQGEDVVEITTKRRREGSRRAVLGGQPLMKERGEAPAAFGAEISVGEHADKIGKFAIDTVGCKKMQGQTGAMKSMDPALR